ncbi:phosphonopyruvate decarboxylase [Stappia indica]|uniref:phosphonopyruvate decarboxylase n=1 Tax=Stappia indica TaxID=538381 RepID=UPI001D18247E|nr:phosphonopyruvate decarboxylase [Stappia indica]MCC4245302.1 phosphonopyruvate decarboxylase [Stappia indica]
MIEAGDFLSAAKRQGIDFFTGVPCSFLTPLMNAVISDREARYVGATSEGEAVAIAAGAWCAGRETVVMFQNSGLGNAVNPLTSLNHPFAIPTLVIATWRGEPGVKDEPQHELMGQITPQLLALAGVHGEPFPLAAADIEPVLSRAIAHMRATGQPVGLVQPKGAIAPRPLDEVRAEPAPRVAPVDFGGAGLPRRMDVLALLRDKLPESAGLVATTGHTGRELFTLQDHAGHLYCVGSMGGASAIGLGAALNCEREIAVLDGDGAALMKLGNMATIGAEAPARYTHVLLDNGRHLSTGGQATVSAHVDFASVAAACGYRFAARARGLAEAGAALDAALAVPGPRFVHVKVAAEEVAGLGRPTVAPREVARRFRAHLTGAA